MAAYNIFPENTQDILDLKLDNKKTSQLLEAYLYTKKAAPNESKPFALSRDNSYSKVKVRRYISSYVDFKVYKKIAPSFTFTSGDGSRTKKGLGSKGTGFEHDLYNDLIMYVEEGIDSIKDANNKKFIKELVKYYSLDSQNIKIDMMGKRNTKRDSSFSGENVVIGKDFNNFDIGDKVTDITITGNKEIYLSLKYKAFAFFNMGIVNTLSKDEIKKGLIKDPNGIALLNIFGIDNAKFCNVFNHYRDSNFKTPKFIDSSPNYNESKLQKFLLSGIGYGYHFVHKLESGSIDHYELTKSKAESKVNVKSVKITYPFVSAKVLYVDILTDYYLIKVMFRNNLGDLYPNVCIGYAHPIK